MRIVLVGPPGAGKGTQAHYIASHLTIPRISTGDIFRYNVTHSTELGAKAKEYMDRGDLVPDPVILGIMKEALGKPETAKGVVLDGVVRTVPQAEGLARVLAELGKKLDAVLVFDAPDDELVRRLGGRTVCDNCATPYTGREPGEKCEKCGVGTLVRRKDDEPEAIKNRLVVFQRQTAPVLAWYRSHEDHGARVVHIDAVGPMDEITKRMLKQIGR